MASMYTKNGLPLTVRGDRVYNNSGEHFGYVRGDRVYATDGAYRGTIVGDRLIYRSTQAASRGGSRGRSAGIGGSARANRPGTAAWGDEPNVSP